MRVVTLEQLTSVFSDLPPQPRVITSGNFATPHQILGVLDAQVSEYTLHMLNAHGPLPDRPGVTYETTFVGPGMRNHERLVYIPCRLSLVPVLFHEHYRPDVVLVHTSARRHDTVSLGTEVNVLPAAIEAVRERGGIVVAQANTQMPYTYGDAQVYLHEIDFLVEVDEPLTTHEPGDLGDTARTIGERIAALVTDASTLQMGIGAVPDAVLAELTDRKGLRIWTEMFSDGVLGLHRAGALDPDMPITASFVFCSSALNEWLHLN